MTREELFAIRKQAKWERLARLQQQVMPMIFGMGDAFAVTEVDIRPDDRVPGGDSRYRPVFRIHLAHPLTPLL